jgi:hypothetical protein
MLNPFGAPALKKVLSNIRVSLAVNPRKIHIVYYGPQRKDLLEDENWLMPAGKIENDMCLVWESIAPGESNRCGGRIFS